VCDKPPLDTNDDFYLFNLQSHLSFRDNEVIKKVGVEEKREREKERERERERERESERERVRERAHIYTYP